MVTHALSTRQRRRVLNADNPLFWNLAWPIMRGRPNQPDGTFYFNNQPNMLDQFVVNKNMAADGSPMRAMAATIDILRFPGMTDPGDYPKPIPFGGMGDPVNQAGSSHHFPVGIARDRERLTHTTSLTSDG